jgi:hypothetical protein
MKKSLVNPVIHEIRSANPQKPRFSAESTINSSNKYQNSIDGMAGVGYNRDSNKLRQLQQDASTIATGARPNPEKNEKRFMGLFGNDVFNEPQKTMSSEDLQMRQNSEMLRHGNANRRFGKSNSVKKSSYENGIAGAGYSGEIVVTPKKGRPYKGQPNSLPLVSKRKKINKGAADDGSLPDFWNNLLNEVLVLGGTGVDLITSPVSLAQIGQAIGHYPDANKFNRFISNMPKLGSATRVLNNVMPATDYYSTFDLAGNIGGATGKEIAYNVNNRGIPAVRYYDPINHSQINRENGYVKNFDSFGESATSNYGMLPHDWDIWGLGKYISPPVRYLLNNKIEDWFYKNPENVANFSDLPYHRQLEEQLYGRPIETRRTPDWQEAIRVAMIQPFTGQMVAPKGKDINTRDFDPRGELANVFGDASSYLGMNDGVLSDVRGWTKGGQRRRANIYRDQPDNLDRQSLAPYSTNAYDNYGMTNNDPKLGHGIFSMFENTNPFYNEKNVNDYTYEHEGGYADEVMTPDKEWMVGARLTRHGPYADVNQTAYWQPEEQWGKRMSDWYNSMFNNNQNQYAQPPATQPLATQPAAIQPPLSTPTAQPASSTSKSKWKSSSNPGLMGLSTPTPTPTPITKSLTANKRKFEESKKSLNFTKSLNSGQNKYDTTSKNQIPFRNKYLK